MGWPMVEWVLDQRYAHLFHRTREAEASVIVYDLPESIVTPLMIELEQRYRGLKSFSLPSMGEAGVRRHIELGVRGAPEEVTPAIEQMKLGWLRSAAGGKKSLSTTKALAYARALGHPGKEEEGAVARSLQLRLPRAVSWIPWRMKSPRRNSLRRSP